QSRAPRVKREGKLGSSRSPGSAVGEVLVFIQEEQAAVDQAGAFPNAVAGDEAAVEGGEGSGGAWHEGAIDPDEDGGVAWVFWGVLAARHGGSVRSICLLVRRCNDNIIANRTAKSTMRVRRQLSNRNPDAQP